MIQPKFLPLCLTALMLLSGCISVDVKPKEVIEGTVDVGKNVYETIRRNRNGEEERLFTHTIPLRAEDQQADIAIECLDYLHELAKRTSDHEPKILSESTELIDVEESQSLSCTLAVLVKTK